MKTILPTKFKLASERELKKFTGKNGWFEPTAKQLGLEQRAEFYKIYNRELRRLAVEDPLHPPHAEEGVNVFLLVVILVIIAVILYFAFVRHVTG